MQEEKRRKRIERLKGCIQFARFLRRNLVDVFCLIIVCISVITLGKLLHQQHVVRQEIKRLQEERIVVQEKETDNAITDSSEVSEIDSFEQQALSIQSPEMLPEYVSYYEENPDIIGWLRIEGTIIDYPVMQTPEDEEYYLHYDFSKKEDKNGCLVLDTDSNVGTGTVKKEYRDGSLPSTNLIVYGHTMMSGKMFGNLNQYENQDYGEYHDIICFDSLYEKRKYKLIAVFYSQVYHVKDKVFKYYKFFEADTKEEFDDWYSNIKKLSIYDTGQTAEWGDEFITLTCCAYHVENGRFVVVGKRIE